MGNLKPESPLVAKIYAAWKKEGDAEPERTYLGASILGHECDLYLWLAFRQALPRAFDGRLYRLFDRGKREEAVFAADLRRAGCTIWEFDPETGKQFSVSFADGHGGGHLDGVALGIPDAPKTPHVVEYKTHSDASFRKLVKSSVAVAKPMHYDQMQVYMGKMGLDRALYLSVNKDTDELYAERVTFDKARYEMLMRKAERLIAANDARPMTDRPDDFRCATCPAKTLCHKSYATIAAAPITCRTCAHWTAEKDGACSCALGNAVGTACASHVFLPFFVNASVQSGTRTSVTYKSKDGHVFTNGPDAYSSADLVKLTEEELAAVDIVKREFPGSHVQSVKRKPKDLYALYLKNDPTPDFVGTQDEFALQFQDVDLWKVVEKQTADGGIYFLFENEAVGFVKDGRITLTNIAPF